MMNEWDTVWYWLQVISIRELIYKEWNKSYLGLTIAILECAKE